LKRKEGDTKVLRRRVYCSANSPQPAWPGTAIPEPSDFKTWDGPKPISVLGSTGSIGTQVYYHILKHAIILLTQFMYKKLYHSSGSA
jgi:hypothetical protein